MLSGVAETGFKKLIIVSGTRLKLRDESKQLCREPGHDIWRHSGTESSGSWRCSELIDRSSDVSESDPVAFNGALSSDRLLQKKSRIGAGGGSGGSEEVPIGIAR